MTSKFEQLIEYVINDEEAKAKELFHDIVVEKSREIYENLMDESEELDEESTHDEDDKAEKAGEKVTKDIEYDDKKDRMDEEEEELELELELGTTQQHGIPAIIHPPGRMQLESRNASRA